MDVKLYDTTLRDGTQGEGISFSVADKIRIALELDKLGIHYIEGGWPGSNPKDIEFFKQIREYNLKTSKIAAFGSTRRANVKPEDDSNLIKLIESETPVVTMFGKSWVLHVTEVLKTTLEENLKMIYDSIHLMKKNNRLAFYDAEHFFDGYKADRSYAIQTLKAAEEAGADCVILCDTNGGSMPHEIYEIVQDVKRNVSTDVGIHCHNDSGVAVANSLMAVHGGAVHIQGTMNGFGERTGNANLTTIIPNLKLKCGYNVITDEQLRMLCEVSQFVDDLANRRHDNFAPFVGISSFAHKGGMHVNAVKKTPISFEHIDPALVGNQRRVLISELSGKSNITLKAKELNIDLDDNNPEINHILKDLKRLEHLGYEFEAAEGSFELLIRKHLQNHVNFFELIGFRVIVERREGKLISEATMKVRVGNEEHYTVAEGDGPVNAMDCALRKALEKFYPEVARVELIDFKVRVIDEAEGTRARVRVLIESRCDGEIWGTVGVSENIIEACWEALADSVEYKLVKDATTLTHKK
ncbi:MAG: citramalate synthase [Candidatus Auribacterota bacterium]|jgi:2-isopropylmalate synthase|uniref:Citramalate synthase n=1 Tax=Candidatus Auribacter fodinae TaxID=2093366 RepID=A0A3A4RG22_9BACT|nr:MAG: citramalate synthase [Candidatus Auribacter fodinae]